jgi:hypothetical protein
MARSESPLPLGEGGPKGRVRCLDRGHGEHLAGDMVDTFSMTIHLNN